MVARITCAPGADDADRTGVVLVTVEADKTTEGLGFTVSETGALFTEPQGTPATTTLYTLPDKACVIGLMVSVAVFTPL